nr:fibronectin type III domain-containing protein [Chloroflexota bacterium]
GVGGELATVVSRAMAKDPQERYGTAEEMLRALNNADTASVPAPAAPPDQGDPTIAVPVLGAASAQRESAPTVQRRSAAPYVRSQPQNGGKRRTLLLLLVPGLVLASLLGCFLLTDGFGLRNNDSARNPAVVGDTTTATPDEVAGPAETPRATVAASPTSPPTATEAAPPEPTRRAEVSRPGAPADLTARSTGPRRVAITWTAGAGQVRSYQVQRSTDGTSFRSIQRVQAPRTTFTDQQLTRGTTYFYRVRASNPSGDSPFSEAVEVQTPAPAATATTPPTPTEAPPTATPTEAPPTRTPRPTVTPTPTRVPPTATPEPTETPNPSPTTAPSRTQEDARVVELEDNDFTGGFTNGGRRHKDRTAQWVYSQQTDYSTMSAKFRIPDAPVGTVNNNEVVLRLLGMDSENRPKTAILIEVNDVEVFRGDNPLPDDNFNRNRGNWGEEDIRFNADALRRGNNVLTITNLETEGGFSEPPWFMLDKAFLAYFVE